MATLLADAQVPRFWGDWPDWGDRGDGSYNNLVLPGDYSDLDCIRVGSDYYAITSTFQYSPGVAILHSKDLVNWSIVGHAVSDVTQIASRFNWSSMNGYARGVWAGAIRYHDGKFWVYFGTPDEGYFIDHGSRSGRPVGAASSHAGPVGLGRLLSVLGRRRPGLLHRHAFQRQLQDLALQAHSRWARSRRRLRSPHQSRLRTRGQQALQGRRHLLPLLQRGREWHALRDDGALEEHRRPLHREAAIERRAEGMASAEPGRHRANRGWQLVFPDPPRRHGLGGPARQPAARELGERLADPRRHRQRRPRTDGLERHETCPGPAGGPSTIQRRFQRPESRSPMGMELPAAGGHVVAHRAPRLPAPARLQAVDGRRAEESRKHAHAALDAHALQCRHRRARHLRHGRRTGRRPLPLRGEHLHHQRAPHERRRHSRDLIQRHVYRRPADHLHASLAPLHLGGRRPQSLRLQHRWPELHDLRLILPARIGDYRGDRLGIFTFNNAAEAGTIDVDSFVYDYDQPAPPAPPVSRVVSLVHRYSFSETSGTTVADSVGGSAWNGTLPMAARSAAGSCSSRRPARNTSSCRPRS